MENINLPIALHVFLVNNKNEVLLLKRANTGYLDGFWSVPAGRLNGGESIRQGAIREAYEEVNVMIDLADLGTPLCMHHKNDRGERLYFFFITHLWQNNPVNKEIDKCSEIAWFPITSLPEDMIEHVRSALMHIQEKNTYIEFGF
jgi:8-oxo-dGTP diphosphatase